MNTATIIKNIAPYRAKLLNHSLYGQIKTMEDLHCFLENHVYAVWD
ncbi:MAG: DUF3050 domain-containing protein, partial [Confluentibacter sp.]|nr:DUF3050 domain-containing protein [Confluentibacter sp.]